MPLLAGNKMHVQNELIICANWRTQPFVTVPVVYFFGYLKNIWAETISLMAKFTVLVQNSQIDGCC